MTRFRNIGQNPLYFVMQNGPKDEANLTPGKGIGYTAMKFFAHARTEGSPMAATILVPEQAQAERRGLAMEFGQVVRELVGIIGGPDVAVIGGVGATSLVSDWMNGRSRPKTHDREMKIRLALRLARIVGARIPAESVRAWFWAADEQLDDEAPMGLLAERPHTEIQRPLLLAARGLVQSLS
jgi:hypothetical protein